MNAYVRRLYYQGNTYVSLITPKHHSVMAYQGVNFDLLPDRACHRFWHWRRGQ